MFYVIDYPDVEWVNQQLNRNQGDAVWTEPATVLLLDQGLSLLQITDSDEQEYIKHGIHYLKARYRDEWNEEWDRLYTPEFVAYTQAEVMRVESEIVSRNLSRYIEPRKPTLEDIIRLVQAGYIVDIATRIEGTPIRHALLVYNFYTQAGKSFVSVYEPRADAEDTLFDITLEELKRDWDGYWIDAWWRAC
jgi:hypothetical protein